MRHHFRHFSIYLRSALWVHFGSWLFNFLAIVGVVAGGSLIAFYGAAGDPGAFFGGIALSLAVAAAVLYGGFISYRDEHDLLLAAQDEARPRSEVRTRTVGAFGYVEVENRGSAENVKVNVSNFTSSNPRRTINLTWQDGSVDRHLMRGERGEILLLQVEPDPPNMSGGYNYIARSEKPKFDQWMTRRREGRRIVRFAGLPQHADIEVEVGKEYYFELEVLSVTQEPVRKRLSFGVTGGNAAVIPYDVEVIAAITADEKRRLDEMMESIRNRVKKTDTENEEDA